MGKASSKLSAESLDRLRYNHRHHDNHSSGDNQGGSKSVDAKSRLSRMSPSSLRNPKTSSKARGESRELQLKNLRKGLSLDQLPLDAQLNNIMDDEASLASFLTEIFYQEVELSDSMQTLFRGNCMASKIMSLCFRTFGSSYLKQLLEPHIRTLLPANQTQAECIKGVESKTSRAYRSSMISNNNNNNNHGERSSPKPKELSPEPQFISDDISYEIDSTRLEVDGSIDENQKNLLKLTKQILDSILSSADEFPSQLNLMCVCLRRVLSEKYPNSSTYLKAIGTVIFLRFINPAIVAPYEAGIVGQQPPPRTMRGLMLVSKILQNIANNVEFSKECHMLPFNEFVRTQFEPMRHWVSTISSEQPGSQVTTILNKLNNNREQQQQKYQQEEQQSATSEQATLANDSD